MEKLKKQIKDLLPFKKRAEDERVRDRKWHQDHMKTKVQMINANTGRMSTLWNVPTDVKQYLLSLSMEQRGLLYDLWQRSHNFSEFCRFRMKKEGFKVA